MSLAEHALPVGPHAAAGLPVGNPQALFERLRRESVEVLGGMFDGFFDAIGEQTRLAWLANTGSRTRTQDRDMAEVLAERADRFLEHYRQRIGAGFDAWQRMESAESDARRLSLMSDSQLQMQLMAQSVGDELVRQVGGTLATFEGRMANLGMALGMTQRVRAPVHPARVVDAFIASFRSDDLSPDLQATVFRQFERRLVPTLSLLYARLNKRLLDAGYPTEVLDNSRSRPFDAVGETVQQQAGWMPDGGMVEHLPAAPVPAPIAKPVARAAPVARASVPEAGDGVPMRYRDLLRDRLAAWREGLGLPSAGRDGGGLVLGMEELTSVASLLQGDEQAAIAEVLAGRDETPLGKVLRQTIVDGARQLGLVQGAARFARDEEDAIDLVAILFQSLAETSAATRGQPGLYARLVMSYLRLALVDDSLFNRRTHPARRLLDALVEVCEDDGGETDGQAMDLARRIVERIVAGYREDLEIFELATDELRQFQEQQRRRAERAERRAAEALHGRERLQQAREDSYILLSVRLDGTPLTEAFHAFLQGPWRHALDQAWLREGYNSAEWRELVRLGDALVALDADAAREDGRAEVAERWLALEPQVAACCDASAPNDAATRETIALMVYALAHPDAGRSEQALPAETEEAVHPSVRGMLRLVGGTDEVPHDTALAARMRRLRTGQSLQLVGEEGNVVFARVAWISPLTGRLLIVNRRGQRKLVASPEQLAALVAAGRVALREAQAPSDLAIKRLWYQLHPAQDTALAKTA